MKKRESVLIIGGGVIGVCSAYYLAERGMTVTLVERDDICSGCSYGNAGLIVPSHSVPLATPKTLAKGLKWLWDVESPFYIRPRFDLALLSWLLQFRAACREAKVRQAVPLLRDLQRASVALYGELASLLDFGYRQVGMLTLFKSGRDLEEGVHDAELLREHGFAPQVLDQGAVREREPCVRPEVVGGIYCDEDAHLDPSKFVTGLARLVEGKGVRIQRKTEVIGFEVSGRKVLKVKTTKGDFQPEQVVLAAGAWSALLARDLKIKLPVQPAKGYSITVRRPDRCPSVPLILSEARVAVTPLNCVLRFAGTLELAGFDLSINRRRVQAILRAIREHLQIGDELEQLELWRGLRPCTPDGLPIVGRSGSYENLIFATGHGTLGMSLGPITGKLVAQIASGEKTGFDLTSLKSERFQ